MAKNFTLSARITADASGLKTGAEQGAKSVRDLGKEFDAAAAKAKGAEKAFDDAVKGGKPAPVPPSPPTPPKPPAPPVPPPAPPKPGLKPGELADWQKRNLRSQYFDIGTSLYGGMNPLTVLAQQGPQIAEVYGSVGNALRGTAAALGGVAGAVAGVTAAVGAGAIAWARYNSAREAAAQALNGVGRGSGLTLDALLQQQGAGLSRAESLQAATAFAGTGRIGGAQSGELLNITRQYMRATGQDAGQAGEEIARGFSTGMKGADELNARFGHLDATTRHLLKTFDDTGQTVAFQRTQFQALLPALRDVEDRASGLNKTWQTTKRILSDLLTAGGRNIDRGMFGFETKQAELRAAEESLAKLRVPSRTALGNLTGNSTQIQKLEAHIEKLKKDIAEIEKKTAAQQKEQEDNRNSITRTDAIRSLLPQMGELERLNAIQKAAEEVIAGKGTKTPIELAKVVEVLERVKAAKATILTVDERALQSDELAIKSIQARTAGERAHVAALKERLALAGTETRPEVVRQRVQAQRDQVFAQEKRSAEDRLRDARYSAELIGLQNFDRGRREIEQRWRKTLLESRDAPEATVLNRRAMASELDSFTRSQQLEPLRQGRQALLDQTQALERLQQGFGATAGAAAEFATRQQLLNEYQRNNIPITAGVRAEIERLAAAQGRTAQATDELQRAQQRVVAGMDEVRSGARSMGTSIFSAWRQGKSPAEAFRNSLGSMLDRGFERAVSAPITEMLLGRDGQRGGGMFGDSVSKLFGGASLQTANITAANVVINGAAIGSATGLPTDAGKIGAPANDNAVFNKQQVEQDWYAKVTDRVPQAATPSVPISPFGTVTPFASGDVRFDRGIGISQAEIERSAAAAAARASEGIVPFAATPVPPVRSASIEQFETSVRRASEATDSLQGGFQDVTKTLNAGGNSLGDAASNVKTSAGEFTTGADGVFGAVLGGIGRIGNSFVSGLGTVLQTLLQALSQAGGGGGGGILSALFGGGGGETAISSSLSAMPTFARGGIATGPSIFGEAGAEAAVPLPDGRRIPVALRLTGGSANDNAIALPLTALAGAVGKLNERIAGSGAAAAAAAPQIIFEDRVGVSMRKQEEDNPGGGGRRQRVIIDEVVADAVARPNSKTSRGLNAQRTLLRR